VNWLSKEILFYLSGESDGNEGENGARQGRIGLLPTQTRIQSIGS